MKQAQSERTPVHLFPQSGKNAVEGWVEDDSGKAWLKVRVTVLSEDGKANKALLKLLAKTWNCPVSALSIASGETSRHKIIAKA